MSEVRSLDLTNAFAPALSTTSDMPKVAAPEPPPPKAEVKAEDTAETEARVRQREAEDARERALDERFERVRSVVEKTAPRTETKVTTQQADPRPQRRDFDDPDAYEDALVTWSAKSASRVTQAEIEKRREAETQERTQRHVQAEQTKRLGAWTKSVDAALEKYLDYKQVAEAADVPISPAMARSIIEENLESGKGYEIAYYLGKHKDEAAKIAALPTVERQQVAIGRLAERLAREAKAAARDSSKRVESRAGATKGSHAEESMEQYAARRNAEIRANRGARYG